MKRLAPAGLPRPFPAIVAHLALKHISAARWTLPCSTALPGLQNLDRCAGSVWWSGFGVWIRTRRHGMRPSGVPTRSPSSGWRALPSTMALHVIVVRELHVLISMALSSHLRHICPMAKCNSSQLLFHKSTFFHHCIMVSLPRWFLDTKS